MTRSARACALALLLHASAALGDEAPVRLTGATGTPAAARVRAELEALGHRVVTAGEGDVAGEVRVESGGGALVAVVAMRDRPPARVAVDPREPEAEGLFALRVAEAVRAGTLAAPASVGAPAVVPRPPAPPSPPERAGSVGVGARMLASPSGVAPLWLPYVRARWGRSWYADASLAWPSWGGSAGGVATLRALQVTLGGGRAFALWGAGAVEAGLRVECHALWASRDDAPQVSASAWTLAASAVVALRWRPLPWAALRAGIAPGVTLREGVSLVTGERTVAEWGRAFLGAEAGAEFLF